MSLLGAWARLPGLCITLMEAQREVIIRKLLYGGQPSYVWSGRIIQQTPSGVVVEAAFTHARRDLGYVVLEPGDRWVESYFFDRWYNIFEIYDPNGALKGWYCNVCTPAQVSDAELTFVDLALDLFVYPDGRYLVLDEDEFARARDEEYRTEDALAAEHALQELIALARARRLPRHDPIMLGRKEMENANSIGNLLSRDEAALVIVDIQERLVPAIANHEVLLANVMRLLRFARLLELPILASQQIKLGPLVSEITRELPDLQVTTKAEFDALKCPEFVQRVDEVGRGTLIVVGIETHICVAQTVLHALPCHRVHVIADAVGSRTEENWRIGIERMRQAGAVISSTEMLMYELMEKAGTDEFRAMLELVKGT